MTRLRFLGPARDVTGEAVTSITGATVGEVLDAASSRYGQSLDAVLAASVIWLNGEPAARDQLVGPDDEVAVLPPVSGG